MSENLNPLSNLKQDFPASIVVFLVALPLCLGIALASGAPLFSGIIAGIIGGLTIPFISRSPLSVSGPAAGLASIVVAGIDKLGGYEVFLMAVVIAGLIQVTLGFLRAGTIGNYFPSSVIKGMLAAIGLILILKQIPHAVGYDMDFAGDESFIQPDGENTFTEIIIAFSKLQPGVIIVAAISFLVLILWEQPFIKKLSFSSIVPGPLVVVFLGVIINQLFMSSSSELVIAQKNLVTLPTSDGVGDFLANFSLPDFSSLGNQEVWIAAVTIALVASIESLLSIDAVDKLDPYRRITPLNRELKAQGIANLISGLIGGLPVTSVIVRSSANVSSGAKTKASAFMHGFWLLLAVLLIPGVLNKIPLGSLAAILIMVGYKLAKPSLFISLYKKGWDQFLPFLITVLAVLLLNLLQGILIGIVVGLIFVLKSNFHRALFSVQDGNNYLIRLTKDVSFLNKALLRSTLREIPDGSSVIIDGARSSFIDHDILETLEDFRQSASIRDIQVELKQSVSASNPTFKSSI